MLAADLDGVRPREVVDQAVLSARDGELAVVIDRAAGLWLGEGRLKLVETLERVPDGLLLADELALWSVEREGLWARTSLELRGRDGARLRRETLDGPTTQVLDLEDGVLLAQPGALVVVPVDGAVRTILLPFLVTESVDVEEGWARVYGDGGAFAAVDLATGCSNTLPDEGDALTRLIRWRAADACADRPPLPTDVRIEAEEARAAAVRGAVAASSPTLLAALGVRTRAAVLALAPGAVQGTSRLTYLGDQRLSAAAGTFGKSGAILLQDLDTDLVGWAKPPYGPACSARLLLTPSTPARAARYSQILAALQRSGEACADQVALLPVGTLADTVSGATIRYTSARGDLLARRVGLAGPMQVRLDVASLTPQGDALTVLGKLPLFAPAWLVPAARAQEATLDVDGSLVAAAGWEVIRVDPSGKRVSRASLPGPARDLAIRKNGTIDAVVGGQAAVVDLDKGEVRWHEPSRGEREPAVVLRDAGAWSFEGAQLRRAAGSGGGAVRVVWPVEIRAVAAVGGGAIVQTDLGLFGVDDEGAATWRLPDTGAWAVTGRTLIASTAGGLAGYELGR